MRALVISDIHSNLGAFEAVLADAGEFDRVICLVMWLAMGLTQKNVSAYYVNCLI